MHSGIRYLRLSYYGAYSEGQEQRMGRVILVVAVAFWLTGLAYAESQDPYIWLEDAHGSKATAWVEAENAKSTGILEKDSRYAGLYQEALTIVQAKDRIPSPNVLAGAVYNFWQDAEHVRGIWR